MKIKKYPLYLVKWQDAAFSYRRRLPRILPPPSFTVGFLTNKNKSFIKLVVNFKNIKGRFKPIDGFLIPRKTIIKMTKLK